MMKHLLLLCLIIYPTAVTMAQDLESFYKKCPNYYPGDTLLPVQHHQYVQETNDVIGLGAFDKVYSLTCTAFTRLFNREVIKMYVTVDSGNIVQEVDFYLPEDTLLHQEIEQKWGKPAFGWMAFPAGEEPAHYMADRFWNWNKYRVWFRLTKYHFTGRNLKDNYIKISIVKQPAPQASAK